MDEHHKAQAMHMLRNILPAWCWYFPRDTLKRASGLAEPSPEVGHPRDPWIAPMRPAVRSIHLAAATIADVSTDRLLIPWALNQSVCQRTRQQPAWA